MYELSEPKRTAKCIPPPGLHWRCSSWLLWGWCADCGVRPFEGGPKGSRPQREGTDLGVFVPGRSLSWHPHDRPYRNKHTQICTLSLRTTALWTYSNGAVQIRLETGIGGVKSPKIRGGVTILNFQGPLTLTPFYRDSIENCHFGGQKSKPSRGNFRGEFPPLERADHTDWTECLRDRRDIST